MLTRSPARNFIQCIATVWLVASCVVPVAHAVILLNNGDPLANQTAPTGDLAGSGWQFQGDNGIYSGTPIAPRFFITAKHVGATPEFVFQGVPYPRGACYDDPFTDLKICEVANNFPIYAPLYTGPGEAGQPLVTFGRGTQRGAEVIRNGTVRGWLWGTEDQKRRWGQNVVTSIVNGGPANQYVYATLDQTGTAHESHLSGGDSGGAVFIREGGTWKLAGINYAVDGPHYNDAAGGGQFFGALHDTRGFYYKDGNQFVEITGGTPLPTGFYATRISSKLSWIYSVIDQTGDADGNGRSNLLDFAVHLNTAAPDGPGQATVGHADGSLSIVYRRVTQPAMPRYEVQKSDGLGSWQTVAPEESVQPLEGGVQVVTARVPIAGDAMFLRLRITEP